MHNIATDNKQKALYVNEQLGEHGLYSNAKRQVDEQQHAPWRISPKPYFIDDATYRKIQDMGYYLLAFYQGCQTLYRKSVKGELPPWIAEYLEVGKDEQVLNYGRMNRFKDDVPLIIRPDILPTDTGFVISELDSIPGGFGLVGALAQIYAELGYDVVGGGQGIIRGFAKSIYDKVANPVLGIIVSEESKDYREEMNWLGEALRESGLPTYVLRPEEVEFREEGLFANGCHLNTIYRFFELFDLKNIPKIDLILYAIRKQKVYVTPPLKSYLEEKLLFGLFHHPLLASFWWNTLGQEIFEFLKGTFPTTGILDRRPVPPHATIPDLFRGQQPVHNWHDLKKCSKKERELVIKASGFSELAWGSRGVYIGHDLSAHKWAKSIDTALESFPQNPYILQKFSKGRKGSHRYYDFDAQQVKTMVGRTRLCPYYFVQKDEVQLGSILATTCPLNKKAIHGMVDAIMAPTAVG